MLRTSSAATQSASVASTGSPSVCRRSASSRAFATGDAARRSTCERGHHPAAPLLAGLHMAWLLHSCSCTLCCWCWRGGGDGDFVSREFTSAATQSASVASATSLSRRRCGWRSHGEGHAEGHGEEERRREQKRGARCENRGTAGGTVSARITQTRASVRFHEDSRAAHRGGLALGIAPPAGPSTCRRLRAASTSSTMVAGLMLLQQLDQRAPAHSTLDAVLPLLCAVLLRAAAVQRCCHGDDADVVDAGNTCRRSGPWTWLSGSRRRNCHSVCCCWSRSTAEMMCCSIAPSCMSAGSQRRMRRPRPT